MSTRILLLTALERERDAVLRTFHGLSASTLKDGIEAWRGSFSGMEIIAACFHGMGNTNAAVQTTSLLSQLQPNVVILTGICGAFRSKESDGPVMGDVIVAESVISYESGKVKPSGTELRIKTENCSVRLVRLARQAKQQSVMRPPPLDRPEDLDGRPEVHFGSFLSGEKVIADQRKAAELSALAYDAQGVEMESFGVAMAVASDAQRPEFLLAKSACDFADDTKNDLWQPYAAASAAGFVASLLELLGKVEEKPVTVNQTTGITEETLRALMPRDAETANKPEVVVSSPQTDDSLIWNLIDEIRSNRRWLEFEKTRQLVSQLVEQYEAHGSSWNPTLQREVLLSMAEEERTRIATSGDPDLTRLKSILAELKSV